MSRRGLLAGSRVAADGESTERARGSGEWISQYPELVAQWHPTKNGALGPSDLSYGSARKVWWVCPLGPDHEWQASPNNRTSGKSGCPFCAGRATSVTNNLARLYPELAKQWHPTKNGSLRPESVVAGSARPTWWQCPASPDHEWQAAPHDRSAGKGGCPFCLGMRVAPSASLAELAPEIAAEWHPVRNGRLTPKDVTPTTTRSPWWQCSLNPAHEWRAAVVRRGSGSGCPICAADRTARERGATRASSSRAYVLCLDSDRDRRLALVLFLRSREVDVLGARDTVEARHQAKVHGAPRVVLTVDGEARDVAEIFPGVACRVVPPESLHAWLAPPGANAESVPPSLRDLESFVTGEIRASG